MKKVALAVGLAVVLAGCSAAPTSPSSGETTDAQMTPASDLEYPEGLNETGVTDVRNLLDGHQQTLRETSYTVEYFRDLQENTSGHVTTVHAESTEEVIMATDERTSGDERVSIFQTGTEVYQRSTANGTTTYNTSTTEEFSGYTAARMSTIAYPLTAAEYDNPQVTEVDGETAVAYDVVGFKNDAEAEGTLVVTESGVIHDFELTVSAMGSTIEYDYEVSNVGSTTVSDPDWLEEVPS